MSMLFDLDDFEETRPVSTWRMMHACGVHRAPQDDAKHLADCWHGVCPSCREVVLSPFLMQINHGGADRGFCQSIGLRLNHLTYDIRYGVKPHERDLTVLDLGWRIGPDGSQIPPAGDAIRIEDLPWNSWMTGEGMRHRAAVRAVTA